jgi:two-component system, cell cycle sensor histidine kinase and response regulator CckA
MTLDHNDPITPRETVRPTESILIAEDDSEVRNLVARVLGLAGYQVDTAADGQAALERCTANGARVDLVLCDVIMPVMGAKRLSDALLHRSPGIPIIFMSGHGPETLDAEGGLDPEIPFLSKPFSTTELLELVRATLDRRTAGQG